MWCPAKSAGGWAASGTTSAPAANARTFRTHGESGVGDEAGDRVAPASIRWAGGGSCAAPASANSPCHPRVGVERLDPQRPLGQLPLLPLR